MNKTFNATLWRLVKDVMLDREIYEITKRDTDSLLLYECQDCGYVHKSSDINTKPPITCPYCLNITNELGTTADEDLVWLHVLNNFSSAAFKDTWEQELDLLHPVCDCPVVASNIHSIATTIYTQCAYTIEDLEEIVPICPECNGCISCRYFTDNTENDFY